MATDVRTKMLIAAERLFAERGVDNVSLREIGEQAGQRNNSAVQYHFGNKQGLIQALYDLRLVPLNRARHAMLEQTPDPSLPDLARIYVIPMSDAVIDSRGSWAYARFLDRYLGRGREFEPFDDQHGSGSREVARLMSAQLTGLGTAVRDERLRMIQVLTIRTLADLEHRLEHGLADDDDATLTVAALVEAVSLLLDSPTSVG
ncbi:TetR/AcrR family transcriptional regulator [Nocardioides sp. JQ2195]|uniref:helix-turn-helix domain-containing protein n=1 Tax=Nocardioides sp. JQ2195 TaxID=2592334 RepID=UPI001F0D282E|nr:TetR/AcrR family transcriptional regulator [Nocardioides sp. JQ2195]